MISEQLTVGRRPTGARRPSTRHALSFLAMSLVLAMTMHVGLALGQAGKQLTFALQLSPDVAQVLIALERGYWNEFGVDVRILPFESGRDAFEAMLNGQADFAAMADFPATLGILNGRKFFILGDISRYRAQRVIASKKRIALDSLGDLEGRKLGTTFGTSAEFATSVLATEGGVISQVIDVAPRDVVPALVRGDVDAAVMFPSLYSQARKALGDDYRELIIKGYVSHFLIATRPDVLSSRMTEVVILLQGLKRADALIKADKAAAQATVIRAMGPSMEPAALTEMWNDLDYGVILGEDLVSLMQREATWLIDKGNLKGSRTVLSKENIRSFMKPAPLGVVASESVHLQR